MIQVIDCFKLGKVRGCIGRVADECVRQRHACLNYCDRCNRSHKTGRTARMNMWLIYHRHNIRLHKHTYTLFRPLSLSLAPISLGKLDAHLLCVLLFPSLSFPFLGCVGRLHWTFLDTTFYSFLGWRTCNGSLDLTCLSWILCLHFSVQFFQLPPFSLPPSPLFAWSQVCLTQPMVSFRFGSLHQQGWADLLSLRTTFLPSFLPSFLPFCLPLGEEGGHEARQQILLLFSSFPLWQQRTLYNHGAVEVFLYLSF